MLVHARPRPTGWPASVSFEGCEQLFHRYPLAVLPGLPGKTPPSMVLATRTPGRPVFFVLTKTGDSLFAIRAWNCRDSAVRVMPGSPVPAPFCAAIAAGMPVPRHRAMFGWITDRKVTALLTVHGGDPSAPDPALTAPEIRVMPMSGTSTLDWPPFTASPLGSGWFWDYVDGGDIVDVVPLVTRQLGHAFWVPAASVRGAGCVVVTEPLVDEDFWVPVGVYTDHWGLREGIPVPPAQHLLALPGTLDLARKTQAPAVPAPPQGLRVTAESPDGRPTPLAVGCSLRVSGL